MKNGILPKSSQGLPLKWFAIHLTQKTPQKSCKSRGSDLHVHLRTLVKLPRPSRVCIICKATKYLQDGTLKKQCVPFLPYYSGVDRFAQAKRWGWTQGQWPKKCSIYALHALNMQKVMLNLGFRCRFSGYWAHPCEQISPGVTQLTELMGRLTHMWVLPTTLRWSLLKKSRLFLNQKRRLHRRKR